MSEEDDKITETMALLDGTLEHIKDEGEWSFFRLTMKMPSFVNTSILHRLASENSQHLHFFLNFVSCNTIQRSQSFTLQWYALMCPHSHISVPSGYRVLRYRYLHS